MTVYETSAIKLYDEETVKLKKKSIYTVIMLKLLQDDVTPKTTLYLQEEDENANLTLDDKIIARSHSK